MHFKSAVLLYKIIVYYFYTKGCVFLANKTYQESLTEEPTEEEPTEEEPTEEDPTEEEQPDDEEEEEVDDGDGDDDGTTPLPGDPVLNPEIQPQLTACGVKGGMFGKTRGVNYGCTEYAHNGVDIATEYYVKITSTVGSDTITSYSFHLQENARVSGTVIQGQLIGIQGVSGNLYNGIEEGTTDVHVHIKIRKNGIVVDPLPYFGTEFDETTGEVINN